MILCRKMVNMFSNFDIFIKVKIGLAVKLVWMVSLAVIKFYLKKYSGKSAEKTCIWIYKTPPRACSESYQKNGNKSKTTICSKLWTLRSQFFKSLRALSSQQKLFQQPNTQEEQQKNLTKSFTFLWSLPMPFFRVFKIQLNCTLFD